MLPALLEESASISRRRGARKRLAAGALAAVLATVIAACGGGERQDADEAEGDFPVEVVSAEFPASQRLAQTSELVLTVRNTGDEVVPDLAVTVFTDPAAEEISADEAAASGEETEATATGADGEEISEDELGAEVDQALEEELAAEEPEGAESDAAVPEDLPSADGAFSVLSEQPGLAIPSRPVWVLEMGYPQLAGTLPGSPPPGEIAPGSGAQVAQTNTFAFGELEPDETAEMIWRVTAVQAGSYTVRYRLAAGLFGKSVAVTSDGSIPEGEFAVSISDEPPQTRVDENGKVVEIKKSDLIGQAGSASQQSELDGSNP
jgi:hypothetical protein